MSTQPIITIQNCFIISNIAKYWCGVWCYVPPGSLFWRKEQIGSDLGDCFSSSFTTFQHLIVWHIPLKTIQNDSYPCSQHLLNWRTHIDWLISLCDTLTDCQFSYYEQILSNSFRWDSCENRISLLQPSIFFQNLFGNFWVRVTSGVGWDLALICVAGGAWVSDKIFK